MPSEDSPRRLTPNQWRLIGTALALISLTIIVAFCFGLFVLFREFVTTFAQVLWPLAVSGVLALMLRPIVQIFQDRLKLSQTWAIIVLYALAVGAMLATLGLLLPTLVEQSIRFFNYLPTFIEKVRELAIESYPAIVRPLSKKNWVLILLHSYSRIVFKQSLNPSFIPRNWLSLASASLSAKPWPSAPA